MTIESPCRKTCQIDLKTGYCKGCYRTLTEIIDWKDLVDEEKKKILEKIKERTATL